MEDNIIRENPHNPSNPRFRRYPEYKESGVEWIGGVPAHWEVKRLKYVAEILPSNVDKHIYPDEIQVRLCNYTDVYYNNYITVDTILEKGSCNEREFTKFVLRKGNVIITKDSETSDDIGVPTFVKDDLDTVVCGYHLTMIRPLACHGEFIFRFIQSDRTRRYFEVNSNGITRYGLGKASIENLFLPIPPDSEQAKIANFLDCKTEQIDELIRIKERRIELLQEQRTALINQAVTKGLDPNVEMKPSSVEWIGEIPKHWIISKVKHEFESLDNLRIPLNAETRGSMKLKVYDYYGASGIIDKVENYIFDEPLILIGEDGANLRLRSTPLAFKATGKYWVNNHAHVLKPKHGNIDYLTNMLESLDYTHYITGAAQPKLTSEHLMDITVIVPSPLEQAKIADFLNHKTQQIDDLIATEQRKIELLKEYRQSLISETVTGKIDVRNEV